MSRILKAGSVKFDQDNAVKIEISNYPHNYDTNTNGMIVNSVQDESHAEEIAQSIIESARLEASVIIQNAENEAANILYNAGMEAEQMLDSAREEGMNIFQESKSSGYDQGYKDGTDETTQLKKEAKRTLDDAKKKRDQMLAGVEREIVDVITKTVYKLIYCEANINPKLIINLIHQGFSDATLTGEIKVHVSKDDFDEVMERKDEILEKAVGSTGVEIVKNLSMKRGDCLIETPYGNIDCSLEQQFNALKKNLYILLEKGSLNAAGK